MLKIKQARIGLLTIHEGMYEPGVGVWVGERLYPLASLAWIDVELPAVGTEVEPPTPTQPPAGSRSRRRTGGSGTA